MKKPRFTDSQIAEALKRVKPGRVKPDWNYWGNAKTANLKSAIQLSIDVDPNSYDPATEKDVQLREEYWLRSRVVSNHAPYADWLCGKIVREEGDISFEFTEVFLPQFSSWLQKHTTLGPFPPEFCLIGQMTNGFQSTSSITKSTEQLPSHKLVNGDKKSSYYFAAQSLSVLEDFVRAHNNSIAAAAASIDVSRQNLGKVLNNLRKGKKPWAS